jgi:hypothetical protein
MKNDFLNLENGTDWQSQNVGEQTTNIQCVKTQNSKELIYTAVEA